MDQGNCFFPVNEEEEEKEKEEEEEEEEEEEQEQNKHQEEEEGVIRTTMQSYAAMGHSCACGPRQLFLSCERGGGGGEKGEGGGG